MIRKLLLLLMLGTCLLGCSGRVLKVRSEYLNPEYLSAERVDTPDPCRRCFWGQQVIVQWNLPRELLCNENTLVATLRFGNREIEEIEIPLDRRRGCWSYRLLNALYWKKCGILSYKIDLLSNGTLVDCWKHHVWVDLINISH